MVKQALAATPQILETTGRIGSRLTLPKLRLSTSQTRFAFTPEDTISGTSPSVIRNRNSYRYSGSRSFAQEKVWFEQKR